MKTKPHPLTPEAQIRTARSAYIGTLPEGAIETQSMVQISNRFTLRITELLSVECAYDMNLFGQTFQDAPDYQPAPDIRYVTVRASLDAAHRGQEAVTLHIPDWNAACGEVRPDLNEITRRLAHRAACPETEFPIAEHATAGDNDNHREVRHAIHQRRSEAIGWLLEQVKDGRVAIDPAMIRVELDSSIFDGHGTLLACRLRLDQDDLQAFAQDHGEDCLLRALTSGSLYMNGDALMSGARYSEAKALKICDRVMGRETAKFGFRPMVAWSPAAFEATISPHVANEPFAACPELIHGRKPGLLMLETLMDLQLPAASCAEAGGAEFD
ncbi:hypothetical protein [Leisingera caerulea]|uniref:hypothetical protein n=1 Tax=Leisingera caerulea TaxID=506591 RepID=UPI0004259860|nr:hypothetical protein [Leisingera caerulea]